MENYCLYFSTYCNVCIDHVWLYFDIKLFR